MQTHQIHGTVTSEHIRGLKYIMNNISEPITLHDSISTRSGNINWGGTKITLNKIDEYGIHKEYYRMILFVEIPVRNVIQPGRRHRLDICITIVEGWPWWNVNEPLMSIVKDITVKDMLRGLFNDISKKSEVETNKLNT